MSPTKRPSSVAGLRRGVGATSAAAPAPRIRSDESIGRQEDIGRLAPPAEEPKARVTLNLPAPMYRDLERWAMEAAGTLGVPRVGIQDALRAMVRVATVDELVTSMVVDQLRRERGQ